MYSFICVAALTPNNVKEMFDVAWDSRARWRFIGIELGFDTGTLDAIEHDNRKAGDCLSELISEWLRQSDPRPTRRAMAKALESPSVAVSQATPVCEGEIIFIFVCSSMLKMYNYTDILYVHHDVTRYYNSIRAVHFHNSHACALSDSCPTIC